MAIDKQDNELVKKSLEGDQQAFAELVEKYRERTYWIAYNMVHNSDDARDISQEAFIRVFKSLARFNPKRRFYTWLYQIVVNLCIDHLRKHGKHNNISLDGMIELGEEVDDPADEMKRTELADQVHEVIREIPPNYRTALILRDLQHLSCKEIAKIVGCSYATARWRLHQARKIFREIWEKKEEEKSS